MGKKEIPGRNGKLPEEHLITKSRRNFTRISTSPKKIKISIVFSWENESPWQLSLNINLRHLNPVQYRGSILDKMGMSQKNFIKSYFKFFNVVHYLKTS